MTHFMNSLLHFLSGDWLTPKMPWEEDTIVPVPEQSEAEAFHTTVMKDIIR
jgi:hypothetical protein